MIKELSLHHGNNIGGRMSEITAVVPTRKGSERVKSKNTRPFAGKSLLEVKLDRLIELKKVGSIKDIVVNSDCDESRKISESYGVKFVERDPYLASSDAPITDYWKEVLLNTKTEHSMLCQCTSPLIRYDFYMKAINEYKKYNCSSMIGIDYVKDYLWKDDKSINYDWPEHPKSQDLTDYYRLNFGLVIISKEELLKYNNIKTPNSHLMLMRPDESLDIDNITEFRLAELLYEEN